MIIYRKLILLEAYSVAIMPASDGRWKFIRFLGESYVLDILNALSEKPKRFTDLADICPNESTRTQKVKKLEELRLIETSTIKIKRRSFIHYTLTEKGRKVLQAASRLESEERS